jgi:hypothetical protein
MQKITVLAGLSAAALAGGCYESTPFDDDDDHPDARDAADVAPDVADDAGAEDGAEEAASCGDEKEPRSTLSFIVDGTESFDPSVVLLTDGQVLAVGALMQRDWRTGDFSISCTATLVTDTVVLTAAHCVLGWMGPARPADLRFAVGTDILDPVYTFEVSAVHANLAYRPGGGPDQARGDQAVLILGAPASSLVPEIRPIPINRNPLPDAFMSTLVQNVGYGTTSASGGDNTLRWWTVETVTEITDYDYTVYGGGVSSVCFGDSGGPGMWTFPDGAVHVAGTVSWGDPSCVDYDHFARTDDNIDFLLPYVGPDDPCGGLTWEGRCDPGNVAVWCIDGITYRRDCAACSQTCGDAGPSLGLYCI